MRFSMNTYKSEGTSWVKLNVTASLIWVSFFQIAISLLAYVATFSGQLYFGKSYFFPLFQSNCFEAAVLFWGSYFFRTAAFFSFFRTATFYISYLFRRATFLQHTFSEELLFHSFGSFPQSHFLFIC